MICPHCQQENLDTAKYCRNCGKRMTEASSRKWMWAVLIAGVCGLIAMVATRATTKPSSSSLAVSPVSSSEKIRIGLAYGTEKEAWLNWAVAEFAKTPAGANIQIDLKPLGSIEAANAIAKDDKSITAWAPAST